MPSFVLHSHWRHVRLCALILALFALLIPAGIALGEASAPVASLSVPASGFLGEPLTLIVSFDTVEAAMVAVLTQLGMGAEAVPAAIVFRLLNFWMLLPIAAACYAWLMRDQSDRHA